MTSAVDSYRAACLPLQHDLEALTVGQGAGKGGNGRRASFATLAPGMGGS